MKLFNRLRSTFSSLFRCSSLPSQIDEELRFHLESRTEALINQGFSPVEAARQARIELGSINSHRAEIRHSLGLRWFDKFAADFRYAVRILRKNPAFTLIAASSLALAIGANTTIFSFANQLLFVSLSVPHPEQLRVLRLTGDDHLAIHGLWGNDGYVSDEQFHLGVFPYPSYLQLRQQNHVVDDIFAFIERPDVDITAVGTPEVGKAELVSGNFYTQMQIKPELGRMIEPADDGAPGAGAVAVISDSFWHREFGGAPDVIGKTMRVNLAPVTIIGVNPANFRGPVAAETSAPEVFLPLSMTSTLLPVPGTIHPLFDPNTFTVQVMARINPSVPVQAAEAELDTKFNAAFRGTAIVNKGETVPRLSLEDGSRGIISGTRAFLKPLYILLGLSGLVLLLACANIANLMLARASFRQREISVRLALGASRGRILRQVLTESVLLAAIGGIGGLLLGYLSRNLIPWLMRTGWDGGEMIVGFDWRVFSFICAMTLLTGIAFGIVPAWRSICTDVNSALKEGAPTSTRSHKAWSGKALVGFQVALSTLLTVLAIFFLRTLVNLNSVEPGFRTQDLLLVDITPPRALGQISPTSTLHSRVADAFATVPGVQEVTYINHPLVASSGWRSQFRVEGTRQDNSDPNQKIGRKDPLTMVSYVGPQFFSGHAVLISCGSVPVGRRASPLGWLRNRTLDIRSLDIIPRIPRRVEVEVQASR